MARPQRNNVDYFPFLCEDGKKMFYLEETYGNDGFATFVKLLRELAKTDYHYLNLSENTTTMFLSAKCKVSKDTLNSIIKDLVELGKFDSVLWSDCRVIWCQDFIDSIQDAYNKRTNNCMDYNALLILLDSLGVRKLFKGDSKPVKPKPKEGIKPQSIVEYTKLNESKRKLLDNWFNYRKEIGKEIKVKSTVKSIIKKFTLEAEEKIEWVVNRSIENGWTGLFWNHYEQEKKGETKGSGEKKEDRVTAANRQANEIMNIQENETND